MNKIFNYILFGIVISLISCILYEEISYNRFARYDCVFFQKNADSANVKVLKFGISTEKGKLDSKLYNNTGYISREKGNLPQSLLLQWFDFDEDKFYEYNGDLPYGEIRKKSSFGGNDFKVENQGKNHLVFYINDEKIKNLEAKEIAKPWFNEDVTREEAVFFTRNKFEFVPLIDLKSSSEFKDINLYNRDLNFRNFSPNNISSDTLQDKRLIGNGKILKTEVFSMLTFTLKNPKFKKRIGNEYFCSDLWIRINLDKANMMKIIKNNPAKRYDLGVYLDEKDSVKSVNLQSGSQIFDLAHKTVYKLE